MKPSADKGLAHEKERCKEDEKGDEFGEDFLFGEGEEDSAENAAEKTRRKKKPEPGFDGVDVSAKPEDAAGCAEDKSKRAGGVGNF